MIIECVSVISTNTMICLPDDAIVCIYSHADPLATLAMHSVCAYWNRAITQSTFDMIAAHVNKQVRNWADACQYVYDARPIAHEHVNTAQGYQLIRAAFASSILIRRLSHCEHIHNELIAVAGGNMDVIERFTKGFQACTMSRVLQFAAKHRFDIFYELLQRYAHHSQLNAYASIIRAVAREGSIAVTKIASIYRGMFSDIIQPMYKGALRYGDAALVAQLQQSPEYVAPSDFETLRNIVIGDHVDLFKNMISDHDQLAGLTEACYHGSMQIIRYLMDTYDNKVNYTGCYMDACSGGHIATVKILLLLAQKKHSLAVLSHMGITAACNFGRNHVIKYLVGLGAEYLEPCGSCKKNHAATVVGK